MNKAIILGRMTKDAEMRVTKSGKADIIGVESPVLQSNLDFESFNLVTEALNKLAAYEDAEVQAFANATKEEIIKYCDDMCVSCGEYVPEGRQVCGVCERRADHERD